MALTSSDHLVVTSAGVGREEEIAEVANQLPAFAGGAAASETWLKAHWEHALTTLQVTAWDTAAVPRLPSTGTVTWLDDAPGDYTTITIEATWRAITKFSVTHKRWDGAAWVLNYTITIEFTLDATHGDMQLQSITLTPAP